MAGSTSFSGAVIAAFFTCLPVIIIGAEIFYRVVDVPSQKLARWVWAWVTTP